MAIMKNFYKKNLVSVIIPTFNSSQFISTAIKSVLKQSYSNFEILVVDDGSTDNTADILREYSDQIIYIYKPNGGPASARNIGIKRSAGEYIAFLDADDFWLPNRLAIQVNYLKENPNIALVHSNTWILENGNEPYPAFINYKPPSGRVFEELFLNNHINLLTVMLRRSFFDIANGFDEAKDLIGFEDYDLWLRIALEYPIAYLDKIVSIYRIHNDNISNEINSIYKSLFILNKFSMMEQFLQKSFQILFIEKKNRVFLRWALRMMEIKDYKKALDIFYILQRSNYSKFLSTIGILSCKLKNNFLFRSWISSVTLKRKADYFLSLGLSKKAQKLYLQSIKFCFIQKIAYQEIIKIFLLRNIPGQKIYSNNF